MLKDRQCLRVPPCGGGNVYVCLCVCMSQCRPPRGGGNVCTYIRSFVHPYTHAFAKRSWKFPERVWTRFDKRSWNFPEHVGTCLRLTHSLTDTYAYICIDTHLHTENKRYTVTSMKGTSQAHIPFEGSHCKWHAVPGIKARTIRTKLQRTPTHSVREHSLRSGI